MKKIAVLLLCLSMWIPNLKTVVKAENNTLTFNSDSVVLMDATNKRILYEKNGSDKHYPASTTKIMTMLLGVEKGNLNQTMTMSQEAALSIEFGSSHISLLPGEKMLLKDALYATSLASANDAANGVAETIGGSIDNFVKMMNERAKAIGCTNTNFVNLHGLHDKDHYTTAIDLAMIMSEASQNPAYIEITSAKEVVIPSTNKTKDERYLYTTNRCMDDESEYYIPEVICGKSGYTDQSASCFVAYAKKGDVQLVAVLLSAPSSTAYYQDLQAIFNYGFSQYQSYQDVNQLFTDTKIPHNFYEIGGQIALENPFIPFTYQEGELEKFQIKTTYNDNAKKSAEGEVVGKATLYYDTTVLGYRNIILEKELNTPWGIALQFILNLLKWLVILAVGVIVGAVIAKKVYTRYRNNKRKKRRKR